MSLFSPEEKEEFENVGVGVYQIEQMLPKECHPIFKELIQVILSEEIAPSKGAVKVLLHSDDGTQSVYEMSKKYDLLLKIKMKYIEHPNLRGLAAGLVRQYAEVKSDGFLSAYTSMESHEGEWVPFNDVEKIFAAMRKEMKGKDKELYLSLPNKVTVYRGADVDALDNQDYGFSWTLNQDIARKFATEMSPFKDKIILKAIVDKDYIAAYTNVRKEEECIINTELEDWFEDIEEISSK